MEINLVKAQQELHILVALEVEDVMEKTAEMDLQMVELADMEMETIVLAGHAGGGGAGNPGGRGGGGAYADHSQDKGQNGTGGLLVLYANSVVNNSKISSDGSNGGTGYSYSYSGGGSSGGGSINIFSNGVEFTNNGEITANGGPSICNGGAGGNGSITIGKINETQD